MNRFFVTAAASLIASVLACSSSPAGDQYPTTDSFCAELAKQECATVTGKCGVTVEACTTAVLAICQKSTSDATQSGVRKYVPSAAQACIDSSKTLLAKEVILVTDILKTYDTCSNVYRGNVATDGKCSNQYECASTTQVCDREVCENKTEKSLDQGCGNPGEVCSDATYCGLTGTGVRKCTTRITKGNQCDTDNPCALDLRCDATSKLCVDKSAAGATCTDSNDCAPSAPYCNTSVASPICTDGLRYTVGAKACNTFGANY